jgi:hypothetical protein
MTSVHIVEQNCHRLRSYFMPLALDVDGLCRVCHRPVSEHAEGPCAARTQDFLAPGRCISCGNYTTRDHRP